MTVLLVLLFLNFTRSAYFLQHNPLMPKVAQMRKHFDQNLWLFRNFRAERYTPSS
jgi:hypothetical protein